MGKYERKWAPGRLTLNFKAHLTVMGHISTLCCMQHFYPTQWFKNIVF